jgi:hypothetical protein
MTSTGVAPATTPSQAIVGPLFTASGFKYWYLACLPDSIVAVPQGFWTSIMLAMANNVAPMYGLLGGLASGRGHSLHARIAATLPSTPDSQLRMKPNTVFQIAQLRAINFKGGKFAHAPAGALITPDIILETKSGASRSMVCTARISKSPALSCKRCIRTFASPSDTSWNMDTVPECTKWCDAFSSLKLHASTASISLTQISFAVGRQLFSDG